MRVWIHCEWLLTASGTTCKLDSCIHCLLWHSLVWVLQQYVQQTTSSCFAALRQVRQIRRLVPTATFQTLTVALVNHRLDYGNRTLVGIPAYLMRRLQSALNAAARLIFHLRRSNHVTASLVSLHFAACTGANPIQDSRTDTQSSPVVTHHGTWGRPPLLLMSLVDGHWVMLEPTGGCASS